MRPYLRFNMFTEGILRRVYLTDSTSKKGGDNDNATNVFKKINTLEE